MNGAFNLKQHLTNREWLQILGNEFNEKYFRNMEKKLSEKRDVLCPREELIFRALNLTSYNDVKVVILSQDPYYTPGVADGLAFSSKDVPPSLGNVFKEIKNDIGADNKTGDLHPWANQGVLLLNRILTTETGFSLVHEHWGWRHFTNKVIGALDNRARPVVFLLWGKRAQETKQFITNKNHLILEASHPSPFSAAMSFENCKHFSKANEFLLANGIKPINWQLPGGV